MSGETIEKIILRYEPDRKNILPLVKEINEKMGFLSSEAVDLVARYFSVKPAQIFSAGSFYDQIKKKPSARLVVGVCDSINCQVSGADKIISALESFLRQKAGDDFSPNVKIEKISCIGMCSQGPNMVVNGTVYGKVDSGKAIEIIDSYLNH